MDINKEAQSILEVLSAYYEENCISYIKEDNMIFFPMGSFCYSDDIWTISQDFSFINDHSDIRVSTQIVQEVIDCGIDLTVMEGYWTMLDEESKVIETIWESDVDKIMEEQDITFEEAFISILKRLYKDKDKDKDKKENINLH